MPLTDNEKASIIYNHMKSIEMQKYNAETAVLAEQSLEVPNEDIISGIEKRIDSFDLQLTALQNEINSLNVTVDPSIYYVESSPISIGPIGQ